MEKQPGKQAATEPADSGAGGGEGGPSQVAGAQEAPPEDRLTLLLRLFPPAGVAGSKRALWPRAPPFAVRVPKPSNSGLVA